MQQAGQYFGGKYGHSPYAGEQARLTVKRIEAPRRGCEVIALPNNNRDSPISVALRCEVCRIKFEPRHACGCARLKTSRYCRAAPDFITLVHASI
jgi:hypothetical protein